MQLPIAIIAVIAPLAHANGGVTWSFPDAPEGASLDDISFGMNMNGSPHQEGFFYAQQYDFFSVTNGPYTGLQPRNDTNGQAIVRAVFSSFEEGTQTTYSLCPSEIQGLEGKGCCHDGADGGGGVSCFIEFPGDYTHTYNLRIDRPDAADKRTWRGQVIDATTGVSHEIGIWKLPNETRGIVAAGQNGFVEYYEFNVLHAQNIPLDCTKLPKGAVSFFNPTTLTPGVGPGTVGNANDYGDCAGQSNFASSTLPDGVHIEVHG